MITLITYLFATACGVLLARLYYKKNAQKMINSKDVIELELLYQHFWDGELETQMYAWQKVRNHLMNWKPLPTPQKINYINARIKTVNQAALKGELLVNAYGELIEISHEEFGY
jgi:hypothetical protein